MFKFALFFKDLSFSISKSSCGPSQSFAVFPKNSLNLKAVSAVILRLPFIISEIRVLFDMLRERMPNYASWGFLLAVYGCLCGGVAFALRDILTVVFNIPHHTMLTTLSQYPALTNIIFWIGGPAVPISLLILGIVLARTRTVPALGWNADRSFRCFISGITNTAN